MSLKEYQERNAGRLPKCGVSCECFARTEAGDCTILTSTEFKGRECPFFKTKDQYHTDRESAAEVNAQHCYDYKEDMISFRHNGKPSKARVHKVEDDWH